MLKLVKRGPNFNVSCCFCTVGCKVNTTPGPTTDCFINFATDCTILVNFPCTNKFTRWFYNDIYHLS